MGEYRRPGTRMMSLGRVPVPKPINLPSQRSENNGNDPNVKIVPQGGLGWGDSKPAGWQGGSPGSAGWAGPGNPTEAQPRPSPPQISGPAWGGAGAVGAAQERAKEAEVAWEEPAYSKARDFQKEQSSSDERLETAIANRRLEELESAIKHAESLGMDNGTVATANTLFASFLELDLELAEAQDTGSYDAIIAAVNLCLKEDMGSERLDSALKWCKDKVQRQCDRAPGGGRSSGRAEAQAGHTDRRALRTAQAHARGAAGGGGRRRDEHRPGAPTTAPPPERSHSLQLVIVRIST